MIRAIDMTAAEDHALMATARRMMMSTAEVPAPTEWEHLEIDRASPHVRAGTWKCEPYTDDMVDYPFDEFMVILSGTITLIYPDGTRDSFGPGSAFLLPQGFTGTWHQPETVVKYFVMIGR
ncbi:MAG: cupin domain-containing protein [Roseovarius sp.]